MSASQLSLPLEETRTRPSEFFDPARTPIEGGITLIEASAGTGKTQSIIMTLLRLVLERSPDGTPRVGDISRILVVTFTIAATDQLITRTRELLRKAVEVFEGSETDRVAHAALFALAERYGGDGLTRLREALARIDQLSIFTIHGFCKRVLEESALESATAYDFAFVEDESAIFLQAAHDWWRRTMYGNTQLSTLAVKREWDPRKYLELLKQWRRYPGTVVVPEASVEESLAGVARALDAMARAWDSTRVPVLLDRTPWSATSPLASAESRAFLGESIPAIANGDWGGALEMAVRCTREVLTAEKTGVPKKFAAELEPLLSDPFIASCEAVEPAIERLEIALRGAFIRDVNAAFESEKRRRHVLGFDDLLRRVSESVTANGGAGPLAAAIRERYDAALIDEFQDTDAYQYRIFATAFRDRPLFLIGDPKQAIYSFRGADIAVYMRATADARRRYTLQNNHRSTTALVAAINTLFQRAERPFLEEENSIGYVAVKAASTTASPIANDETRSLCWWLIPLADGKRINTAEAEALFHAAIVAEIAKLVSPATGAVPLKPREIAILVRTNKEAIALQQRLRDAGIPSVLHSSGDILFSDEMADLARLLAAVASPSRAGAVRSAITTTLWGMDAEDLAALSRPEQEHEWQRLVELLADARETWRRHGFMRMVQELFARLNVARRLLSLRDGDRRLTNLRHAVEHLHAEVEGERLSPDGVLLWLARARQAKTLDAERRELRLESDEDAVQISTIHLSKGLEYGVVFCTSLWSAREPRGEVLVRLDDERVVYDLGSPDHERHLRLAAAAELAENLRLAYVAITRARYRVYLGLASGYSASRSALGYLLRPPRAVALEPRDELVQRLDPVVSAAMPQWPDTLASLCASSKGTMSWATLPLPPNAGVAAAPAEDAHAEPRVRTLHLAPGQTDTWRISSYSGLVAGGHAPSDPELDAHVVDGNQAADAADAALTGFMTFPRGRQAGIVLHSIFEQLDFGAAASPGTRSLVDAMLGAGRLPVADAAAASADVAGMLAATVESPLPGVGFRLRDVAAAATRREWRFHLPLAPVTRDTLRSPFERATSEPARSYARHLSGLAPFDLRGYLTGSVDLLFQHEHRWYLVDWKSNDLGATATCYARAMLERAMFTSQYTLQYHLYVLALHRYLRTRLADYDYDRHVGGVWYAFLRGIDGTSDRGWYHDRPPRELIEALDRALLEGAA